MTISTHVFFWVFEKLIKVALNFSEKMNIIMRNVFQHWYLIFNLVGNVFLNSFIISKWLKIKYHCWNTFRIMIFIFSLYIQCSFFYVESKFFSERYLKKFNHNENVVIVTMKLWNINTEPWIYILIAKCQFPLFHA